MTVFSLGFGALNYMSDGVVSNSINGYFDEHSS